MEISIIIAIRTVLLDHEAYKNHSDAEYSGLLARFRRYLMLIMLGVEENFMLF
jgi:hypothetical protein